MFSGRNTRLKHMNCMEFICDRSHVALIAQLVQHCTGNAKVVGSNPVQSLKFFQVIFPVVLWLHSHLSFFHLVATVGHLFPWNPYFVYLIYLFPSVKWHAGELVTCS